MQTYSYKKIFLRILVFVLIFLSGSVGMLQSVSAGTVGHVFFIRLPDGSREPLAGVTVRNLTYRDGHRVRGDAAVCAWGSGDRRELPEAYRFNSTNVCASGVGCYDSVAVAPVIPYSFNSSTDLYTINSRVSGDITQSWLDTNYKRFNVVSGGQTFTEKYPWFPLEPGNPRGSSTAYWRGGVRHVNTEDTVRAEYSGTGYPRYLDPSRHTQWNSIPGYPGYQNGQMRWYGHTQRPFGANHAPTEVIDVISGENGYYATLEWTLIESNPIEAPTCGNGTVEAGEACDNGDQNGVQCTAETNSTCSYCSNDCQQVVITGEVILCGNGIMEAGEECDEGAENSDTNAMCNTQCELNNECNDGEDNDNDGIIDCLDGGDPGCFPDGRGGGGSCDPEDDSEIDTPAVCGDGVVDTGEMCGEPGLSCSGGDTCQSCSCVTITSGPICGDGVMEGAEECDDGNQTAGDGCSASCTITTQCNDGVDNDGDGAVDCQGNGDPGCFPDGNGGGGACNPLDDSEINLAPTPTTTIIPNTALISDEADRVIIGLILVAAAGLMIRFNVLINGYDLLGKIQRVYLSKDEVKRTNINKD